MQSESSARRRNDENIVGQKSIFFLRIFKLITCQGALFVTSETATAENQVSGTNNSHRFSPAFFQSGLHQTRCFSTQLSCFRCSYSSSLLQKAAKTTKRSDNKVRNSHFSKSQKIHLEDQFSFPSPPASI